MIHREDSGDVAVLAMEHGKANAIDVDLFADLDRSLDEVEGSAARALVLTGRGPMFSAGVNLFRVLEEGAPYLEVFLPRLSASVRRLFASPLPVVAAINGHAIAGTLGADEALKIGLVEETADAGDVLERACEAARRMSEIAADAFAATKRQIRRPALERMESLSSELDPGVLEIWSRPETLAGIRTFLERTLGK